MKKKFRNHGVRLLAFMLTFVMLIGLVPASAASKKVTFLESSSIYNATITVTDSKGNEILPGDSVTAGTKLTVKVTPDACYELVEGDSIELNEYDEYGYYYDWYNLYLDKNLTATFTAEHNFSFYVSPSSWYNLTIKGDKHVKSMIVTSSNGKSSKTFTGKTATIKLNKENGFTYGDFNVKFILEDGYIVSNSDLDHGWFNGTNSDGSYSYEAYFESTYDYDTERYVYTNDVVLTVTTKKGKNNNDYSKYDKLTTATATLNKKKGTITLKGKKNIVTIGYYCEDYGYGQEEYISTYDATFNVKNAKSIERIDLSKITNVDKYVITSLLSYLVREYKKGNMPNLKAICLPKGYPIVVSSYDGYMEYYPLVVYSAE